MRSGNPEFDRNLWLEVNRHRIILMPLVLLILFMITYGAGGRTFGFVVMTAALVLFLGITVAWGTRLAAESVFAEARSKTWEIQKLSSLAPWTMTWGKLFGSTVFAWYGGIICLAVYTIAGTGGALETKIAALAAAFAVLAQSLGMLAALMGIRRRPGGDSAMGPTTVLGGLLMVGFVARDFLFDADTVFWFGHGFEPLDFALCSTAAFALWAILGCYRLMCLALQVRTVPWAWLAFALFLSAYLSGIDVRDRADWSVLPAVNTSFATLLALSYIIAFWDRKDPLVVHRITTFLRRGNRRRALQELPPWTVTLALVAISAVLLTVTGGEIALGGALLDSRIGNASVAVLLLALRDFALLYYFGFARDPRRAETTTMIYLGLLYWLAPGLLNLFGLRLLADLVLPPVAEHPFGAAIIASAQLLVAGWLLRGRLSARVPGRA